MAQAFQKILERRTSKDILKKWKRYDSKTRTDDEEDEDEGDFDEFNYISDDDEPDSDLFLRRRGGMRSKSWGSSTGSGWDVKSNRSVPAATMKRQGLVLDAESPVNKLSPMSSFAAVARQKVVHERSQERAYQEQLQYHNSPILEDPLSTSRHQNTVSHRQSPLVSSQQVSSQQVSHQMQRSQIHPLGIQQQTSHHTLPESQEKTHYQRQKNPSSSSTQKSDGSRNSGRGRKVNVRDLDPKTALKFYPKVEEPKLKTTKSVPQLYGPSDTLGRAFSRNQFRSYKEKFGLSLDKINSRPSSEGFRPHSELTIVTPMSITDLSMGSRTGSFILCETKTMPSQLPMGRDGLTNDKMYELLRSRAVVINNRDSTDSVSSTDHPHEARSSTPQCNSGGSCYLTVCKTHRRSGSDTSGTSYTSDVCVSGMEPKMIPELEPYVRVVEFHNQDSIEESVASSEGFTVSKVPKKEELSSSQRLPSSIEESSPEDAEFQVYLDKFFEEGGEEDITTQQDPVVTGGGVPRSTPSPGIIDSLSEENQALIWSNINEVKRVLTLGENPLAWLMKKSAVFDTKDDNSPLFGGFMSRTTKAISDKPAVEGSTAGNWSSKLNLFVC
eukprot:sb/3463127/